MRFSSVDNQSTFTGVKTFRVAGVYVPSTITQLVKTLAEGFYTTRFVEPATPEKAEDFAVQLVREDADLRKAVVNEKSDPPMIYAEEIERLESFEGVKLPGWVHVLRRGHCGQTIKR